MKKDRKEVRQTERRTVEYISSKGATAILGSLPPLELPEVYNSVDFPERPTYEAVLATGEKEVHFHDETTLTTDEDKQKWAEYQELLGEADNKLTNLILLEILVEGMTVNPSEEEWARFSSRQTLKGTPLTGDPEVDMLAYKRNMIVASKEDVESVTSIVMELTGVSEEQLEIARKSFQDSVES